MAIFNKSKNNNRIGYFSIELLKPISPIFFDDKKRSICILAAASILKILLPENQLNKKIYNLFENLFNNLGSEDWIKLYILWELSLVKELGYEVNFDNNKSLISNDYIATFADKKIKIPRLLSDAKNKNFSKHEILEALIFSKSLLLENFVSPNKIKLPISRNRFGTRDGKGIRSNVCKWNSCHERRCVGLHCI